MKININVSLFPENWHLKSLLVLLVVGAVIIGLNCSCSGPDKAPFVKELEKEDLTSYVVNRFKIYLQHFENYDKRKKTNLVTEIKDGAKNWDNLVIADGFMLPIYEEVYGAKWKFSDKFLYQVVRDNTWNKKKAFIARAKQHYEIEDDPEDYQDDKLLALLILRDYYSGIINLEQPQTQTKAA